jgi:hypothetical protein
MRRYYRRVATGFQAGGKLSAGEAAVLQSTPRFRSECVDRQLRHQRPHLTRVDESVAVSLPCRTIRIIGQCGYRQPNGLNFERATARLRAYKPDDLLGRERFSGVVAEVQNIFNAPHDFKVNLYVLKAGFLRLCVFISGTARHLVADNGLSSGRRGKPSMFLLYCQKETSEIIVLNSGFP